MPASWSVSSGRGSSPAIHVPDEAEEAVRDLLRCRDDVRRDVLRWRHRVLKLLARHGRVYHAGKNWSRAHLAWIRSQQFALPALQRAVEASLFASRKRWYVASGKPLFLVALLLLVGAVLADLKAKQLL